MIIKSTIRVEIEYIGNKKENKNRFRLRNRSVNNEIKIGM